MNNVTILSFCLFLVLSVVAGCSSSEADPRLVEAQECIEADPDSAFLILCTVDAESLSDSDHAKYALLYTQAQIKRHVELRSDSLIGPAVTYFDEKGEKSDRMKAFFYQAQVYFYCAKLDSAIIPATKAYDIAVEMGDDCWRARTAEMLGDIFIYSYDITRGMKNTAEAVDYYNRAGMTSNHRYALCDLVGNYSTDRRYEAIAILDSVRSLALMAPVDSGLVAYADRVCMALLLSSGDVGKAAERGDRLLANSHFRFDAPDLSRYAWAEVELGNLDKAERLLRSALMISNTISEKSYVMNSLSNLYRKRGQLDRALQCSDSVVKYQREMLFLETRHSVFASQNDYYNQLSDQEWLRATRFRRMLAYGGIAFALLFFCGIYFYRMRMRLKDFELARKMDEIFILSRRIRSVSDENETLSRSVSEKNCDIDQLNSTIENLFKGRWETINLLCNEYFEKGDSDNLRSTLVRDIEAEIAKLCSPKSMKKIESAVNQYMGNIVATLRAECSFLKEEDIMFLTLVYAGFSPKAICLFTDIKLKYFYNKKARLAERILRSGAPSKDWLVARIK